MEDQRVLIAAAALSEFPLPGKLSDYAPRANWGCYTCLGYWCIWRILGSGIAQAFLNYSYENIKSDTDRIVTHWEANARPYGNDVFEFQISYKTIFHLMLQLYYQPVKVSPPYEYVSNYCLMYKGWNAPFLHRSCETHSRPELWVYNSQLIQYKRMYDKEN